MPTAEERAYLAGLMDGEGTVQLSTAHRVCSISISNTDFDLLEWCRKCTGVGHINNNRYRKRVSREWSAIGQWQVSTQAEVIYVANLMLPYLKTKSLEVELMRDYAERKVHLRELRSNHMNRQRDGIDEAYAELLADIKVSRREGCYASTRN